MAEDVADPPPPPDGYDDPYPFAYPTILLLIGSVLLGIVAMGVFSWLLLEIQGPEALDGIVTIEETDDGLTVTQDLTALVIPFLASLVVVVVIHESIHGLEFRRQGYAVEYGLLLRKGAFFTAALGQFQERDDLFTVGLAPLVVITLVFLPLLLIPMPLIVVTAWFVLVINTAGAIGDLYLCWRLYRLPSKSLFYDVDIEHMYIYEPLND